MTEVPVLHHARKMGKSKYGAKRYLHGFFDILTMALLSRFFYRPMYFFGMIGLPMIILGVGILSYLVGRHFLYLYFDDISFQLVSRPLLILSLGLVGFGINIFLVGLLAELILQLSSSWADKKTYYIAEKVHKNL